MHSFPSEWGNRIVNKKPAFGISLRTKTFIFTTLIILLIQSLNSGLEIGFLYKNIKENSFKRYMVSGKEMKKKLEKSMLFGLPLTQLNFQKLLKGLPPEDLEDLYIIDNQGAVLFSLFNKHTSLPDATQTISTRKSGGFYWLSFPLMKGNAVSGNIWMVVPSQQIYQKLISLIRTAVKNSILFICIVMPFLYIVLIVRIDRPYRRSIHRLRRSLMDRDRRRLLSTGINPDNLFNAEKKIEKIQSGKWITLDTKDIYSKLAKFVRIGNEGLSADASHPDPGVQKDKLTSIVRDAEEILLKKYFYGTVVKKWQSLQSEESESQDN